MPTFLFFTFSIYVHPIVIYKKYNEKMIEKLYI